MSSAGLTRGESLKESLGMDWEKIVLGGSPELLVELPELMVLGVIGNPGLVSRWLKVALCVD